MGTVIYLAEAAAVLWFAAFFVLMGHQYRAGKAAVVGPQDTVGRTMLRHTRKAILLGLSIVFAYQAAATVNLTFGLGWDLPL